MVLTMDDTQSIKLLIDKSLVEQEIRLTNSFTDKLDKQTEKITNTVNDQNKVYNNQLITMAKSIGVLETKVAQFNVKLATVGAVATALGGLLGFFVAQLR